MIGQMQISTDGEVLTKVDLAIKRLRAFEPPEGYYLAFSGGKDSQCVYHLAKMARVKFDAHYSVTSIDPPELIRFIKNNYPDVKFEHHKDRNGKPLTMWTLIPEKGIPPTRLVRYCCEELKESSGSGRFTLTGVRAGESANRKRNQGIITIPKAGKKFQQTIKNEGINFIPTPRGGVVLNYDNSEKRRMAEHCIRTGKALLNPIIDWSEEDVWEFLNGNGIEHCCLYDHGYKRIGCIGCPMNTAAAAADLERYPAYKKLYLKAFDRMIQERKRRGLGVEGKWETAEKVMAWWLEQEDPNNANGQKAIPEELDQDRDGEKSEHKLEV